MANNTTKGSNDCKRSGADAAAAGSIRFLFREFRVFKARNPITAALIIASLGAVMLGGFIYLEALLGESAAARIAGTIGVLAGAAIWLLADKKTSFLLGFFTALVWFWWIALSFLYTDYPFLAPVVSIVLSLMLAAIFWAISLFPIWVRGFLIAFGFIFIEPLGFKWFKPELIIGSSYFSVNFYAFPLIVLAVYLLYSAFKFRRRKKTFYSCNICAFFALLCAFILPVPDTPEMPQIEIKLTRTDIPQDIKWEAGDLPRQIYEALEMIDLAIEERKDMVILPEAAFAMFLNRDKPLIDELSRRSRSLAIVAGGLHLKNNKPYNSAYIFIDGQLTIADKVFLVPFGEASPLPSWTGRWINSLFFNGAQDYITAAKPSDFNIGGYGFRAAICYEAAIEEMYKNSPPYFAAVSNNGWFTPSIEPVLQKLLMRLYARRYGKIIWHSANQSASEIIY